MKEKATKGAVIDEVSIKLGIAKVDVKAVVAAYEEAIVAALIRDGRLRTALGVFAIKERKAGMFRNPMTGGTVEKPAGKRITFRVNTAIKREVITG